MREAVCVLSAGKGKGKAKVDPVLFLKWAPRHEGVLGMEV
jgi:hypothetical protein